MLGLSSRVPGQMAYPVDVEEEALQVLELSLSEAQQARRIVHHRACGTLVPLQGICTQHVGINSPQMCTAQTIDAPVEMSVRVVPVSTMPAVLVRIDVEVPYVIDWSMPKNSDAGEVEVIGLYAACHDVGVTSPEVPDGNSHKVDRTGKLGRVGATERELAIVEIREVEGLEGDANHVLFE